MDLYFLNFKHILIVLTNKTMHSQINSILEENEIEAKLKFVNSYHEAATLIHENKSDPFNHFIVNLSFNNKKLHDFIEYLQGLELPEENYLVEYTNDNQLIPVSLEQIKGDLNE